MKLTEHHACHYRYEFATGTMTFLEIRQATGLSASAVEAMLCGKSWSEADGPLATSMKGVEIYFQDEKKIRAARHRSYMLRYNRARADARKTVLLEMLGNKCAHCGATEGLQFDHIDPSTKRFGISQHSGRNWDELLAETEKCQLLCYTCHINKTKRDSRERKFVNTRSGGKHHAAKLTDEQVTSIRYRFKQGNVTIRDFAKQLGMAEKVVREMLRGITYKNAGGPLASPDESINYITPERAAYYRKRVLEVWHENMRLSDVCKRVPVSSHTAKSYLTDAGVLEPNVDLSLNNRKQPHAKLTPEQVRNIRERFAAGRANQTELANEAGMSLTGMGRLLDGRSYRHAGGPLRKRKKTIRRFTGAEVVAMRERFAATPGQEMVARLASDFGVTHETVCYIVRGKTYPDAGGPLASVEQTGNYMAPDVRRDVATEVVELYRNGVRTLTELARYTGVGPHSVKRHLVAAGLTTADVDFRAVNPSKAKLTNQQVRRYRERHQAGVRQSALAHEAGVSLTAMGRLLRGQTYGSAGGPLCV